MTLSQERRDILVKELEGYAHSHPQGYKLRVILLLLLGYGYIVILLGGAALALSLILGVQYAIPVLIGLGSLFVVRIKPPVGVRLERSRFPQLFQEIDRLCDSLQAPKPHEVVLTDELNAAVLQAPKLGLFAWYTNYLLIGLPLMQSVSPGQFQATLAHEMGHLAGNHSRFSGWVYRVRRAWAMLAQQQGDRTSVLMYPFFKWYEPFFRAYTFVLSRHNEYFADRCSAQYAGTQDAAEDLIRIYVKGAQMGRIWSDIYKQASHQENPPANTVTMVLKQLAETRTEDAQTWLEMALARQTDLDDTHPSLSDRLKAYGYQYQNDKNLKVPPAVSETAAEYYLGQEIAWATQELDTIWQTENATTWRRIYGRAQLRSQFQDYLKERAQSQPLTVEEALKLALLEAEFDSPAEAIEQLLTLVKRAPDHAGVNYHLGSLLLEANQPRGVTYLLTAIQRDSSFLIYGFQPLYSSLKRQGQHQEAKVYLQQFRQLLPLWQRAQEERAELTPPIQFLPHGLGETDIHSLNQELIRLPEVREAYLARRLVKYLPDTPCYVLGIVSQFNRQNPMNSLQSWEVVEVVSQILCLSGDVRVISLNERSRSLYDSLRRTVGARVV
jgi:Zn-dependent protease with chaperone function